MFFRESLKLLPRLTDLRLKFLSLDALRGCSLLGLRQRLLEGRHLSCGPCNKQHNPVIFAIASFYIFFYKVSLTFFLPELPLGKAELSLGPLETLLQGAYLRSQCGGRKQRSLHTHIASFLLDSCKIY